VPPAIGFGGLSPVDRSLRILYLAFYFPPLGGGGVQRTVKFARYLGEFGFEPVFVTGPAGGRTRHAPLDASLEADLPRDARVYRMQGELPGDFRPSRLRRLLDRPSDFDRAWAAGCESAGRRAAAENELDVILASMSPFETSLAAERLAETLQLPWVADLRDPWALDEMSAYPTGWHRGRELRRMRRRLASAARVVMNTPEAAHALASAFPELAERTVAIPNGFDPADFEGAPERRTDDRFRIVHTGALHAGLGASHQRSSGLRRLLGGERVPVDILTRSHVYLLRALERWREHRPRDAGRAQLVLAGDLSPQDREVVERSGVADLVQMPGYVSHAQSVALLRGADLLFLPMHGLPQGERARIVPGKTYEYLAARRPILAAVPEGDARDLVLESGLGHVCEPDDAAAMADVLQRRFQAKREGIEATPAPDAFYRRFERRELTQRLCETLEAVTGT